MPTPLVTEESLTKSFSQDYYASRFAAEIVNTLTNFLFFYLAYAGIQSCIKHGHDTVFLVTYIGYALVGVGSFLFHATLKCAFSLFFLGLTLAASLSQGFNSRSEALPLIRSFSSDPMQLVDELSMIYTTCLMCYATFSYSRSRLFRFYLALALVSLAIFITLYYHYLENPTFHQIAYAMLTAIVLFRSMYVMECTLLPSWKNSEEKYQIRHDGKYMSDEERKISMWEDQRDKRILETMWIMIGYGLSVFLGGFAIWALDRQYCSELRLWRRELGLPWGIVLEGHGWW